MANRDIRFGPYHPPQVAIGDDIQDEIRGVLQVHSFRDCGAIMWPLGINAGQSPGRPAMVLTGDLVRAVQRESSVAVASHWGTTPKTVSLWRRSLAVGRGTEGTQLLAAELGNMEIWRHAKEGVAASLLPEIRSRRDAAHAETMRNKPGWAEHMGKIGQIAGRLNMRKLGPEGRRELARIGGTAAGKRTPREKRASYLKKLKTEGDVWRYERLRDRFVTEARLDGLMPRQIGDLLGIAVSEVYQILYDLANGYPALARELLTPRQLRRLDMVGDFATNKNK